MKPSRPADLDKQVGLDEEALKAAPKWQFKPGQRSGKPVPVRATIEWTLTVKPR